MPYRVTASPIYEQRERLDAIVQQPHVSFTTDNPSNLRYRLHEALNAARILAVEPYASLRVTVRAQGDCVVVTWNGRFTQTAFHVVVDPAVTALPGKNEFEVIHSIYTHPEINCFEFADFDGDIESIQAWVSGRSDVTVLSEKPLTITRR